jgi:hypothetical protein
MMKKFYDSFVVRVTHAEAKLLNSYMSEYEGNNEREWRNVCDNKATFDWRKGDAVGYLLFSNVSGYLYEGRVDHGRAQQWIKNGLTYLCRDALEAMNLVRNDKDEIDKVFRPTRIEVGDVFSPSWDLTNPAKGWRRSTIVTREGVTVGCYKIAPRKIRGIFTAAQDVGLI